MKAVTDCLANGVVNQPANMVVGKGPRLLFPLAPT